MNGILSRGITSNFMVYEATWFHNVSPIACMMVHISIIWQIWEMPRQFRWEDPWTRQDDGILVLYFSAILFRLII